MESNEPKLLRHSFKNPRVHDWVGEVEIVESPTLSFRNSSSPTPMSFFDHGSTTVVPPEVICFDPEVVPHMGNSEPMTSVIPQQKSSDMDVDTPTPIQPLPKPVRRMLFKPVFPGRRNQLETSTPLTSDSAEPLSTNPFDVDGHSKKDELEVTSRAQNVPTSSRPRPPPLSKTYMPTPRSLPPPHHQKAQKVLVPDTRVSLSKDSNATDTDTDAELVVDLLLCGTPEEPQNPNCLSKFLQQEIIDDLPRHDEDKNKDGEISVSVVKDMAAVEGLATQFLQRSDHFHFLLKLSPKFFLQVFTAIRCGPFEIGSGIYEERFILMSHSSCSRAFILNGRSVRSRE